MCYNISKDSLSEKDSNFNGSAEYFCIWQWA